MCTLVVLNECIEGFPLIVAANRDERYNRASLPPEKVTHDGRQLICPRDEEKGGTWIGVAEDGWFVGITNQEDGDHRNDTLSRGKVVEACLEAKSHCDVAKLLVALEREKYNPFNLVFGRPGAMFLCRVWAGHELEMVPLERGVNVVSNDCWGTQFECKTKRVSELVSKVKGDWIIQVVDDLWTIMHDHNPDLDPFQSMCVHAEDHAFGTRSTSIITVSNQKDVMYWYSEGHPCQSGILQCVETLTQR